MKAIDAEELKSLIRKYEMVHIDYMSKPSRAMHKSVIHEVIEDIMLCIDVSDPVPVEVVRCKDCKHMFTDFVMDGKEYKRCELQMAGFYDDWYCAAGERKD